MRRQLGETPEETKKVIYDFVILYYQDSDSRRKWKRETKPKQNQKTGSHRLLLKHKESAGKRPRPLQVNTENLFIKVEFTITPISSCFFGSCLKEKHPITKYLLVVVALNSSRSIIFPIWVKGN